MRAIISQNKMVIPEGCTVTVSKRVVVVEGPRGKLTKEFTHAPIDLKVVGSTVVGEMWFGKKLEVSTIKTVLSHIKNMCIGVSKGFRYKMRFAYAHFPVGVAVEDEDIAIRNFLGEKRVRKVTIPSGCKAYRTDNAVMKDELVIEGNSLDDVSMTAASVHGVCLVKRKDIRKFLDGIYVSSKENITN
eukprot:TRINITY_DN30309_c0_g1_i1.p1 TRINITY_DN30309_c0_g1~~TRINITY_DN30309_c0_g1_i1.p1  ORF type:complete len:187 (+),score=71.11 TRINITY_DN30309_c0_g1_i1:67-627(+)